MSDTKESFAYPEIGVGDTLAVSFDRAFSRPMLGLVNISKAKSVSAIVFADRGPLTYPDCRHRDDPWLLDHPNWVGQPGKAIFELTGTTAIRSDVAQLKIIVAQQAQVIAGILATPPAPALKMPNENFEKRPRGRPRTVEPVAQPEAVDAP